LPRNVCLVISVCGLAAVCLGQSRVTLPVQGPVVGENRTDARPVAGSVSAPGQPDVPYVLGPDDQVLISVLDADEIGKTAYRVDLRGNLNVPLAGRFHAAGLTLEQLEAEISRRLKEYLQEPVVTVSVSEFRSQPVSILGAVNAPGVHQIRGSKTLFEAISEAGGLRNDAGNSIKITRHKEYGPIPLPGAAADSSGAYGVAEVSIKSVMEARNPGENILVKPNDVISIPRAELVYVIGSVKRAGGFILSERASVSVLEALSLAEGLDRTASPANAKILRYTAASSTRAEIPVDVKKILGGKSGDIPLLPNDILFIPNSTAKSATIRALEAAVQIGTGLAIYRPY
jgi:polysaccharide biosynthesis/export protein